MSLRSTKQTAPAPCNDPMQVPRASAGCWLRKLFNCGASMFSGFFQSRPSSLDKSNKSYGSCDHISSKEVKKENAQVTNTYIGERSEKPWRNPTTTAGFRSLLMEENLNLRPYKLPCSSFMDVNRASHCKAFFKPSTSPLEIAKTYMDTAPKPVRIPPIRELQAPWMGGKLQARGTQLPSYTGLRPSIASPSKLDSRPELNRALQAPWMGANLQARGTQLPSYAGLRPSMASPSNLDSSPELKRAEHLTSSKKKQRPDNFSSIFTPSASLPASEKLRVHDGADHSQYIQPSTSFQLREKQSLEREPAREMIGLSIRAKNNKRKEREAEEVFDRLDDDSAASISRATKKIKYEGSPLKEDNHIAAKIAQLEKEVEELKLGKWEEMVFVSKDGRARLKTQSFFASFDQCSDKARGYRACSALAVVISHWLRSNPGRVPTRPDFDALIVKGSVEWQNLCVRLGLVQPSEQNLDINTVKNAGVGPISTSVANSFMGVFNPAKFEYLRNLDSFDECWRKAVSSVSGEERVYIFEWNEHFFVLKCDSQSCYIIDTLGPRLHEDCKQAYMLKFDSSSKMEMLGSETGTVLVCEARDCGKEFVKNFYAGLTVQEMEKDPNKDVASLFTRLQFDLTYVEA